MPPFICRHYMPLHAYADIRFTFTRDRRQSGRAKEARQICCCFAATMMPRCCEERWRCHACCVLRAADADAAPILMPMPARHARLKMRREHDQRHHINNDDAAYADATPEPLTSAPCMRCARICRRRCAAACAITLQLHTALLIDYLLLADC